jgi:hypothetical protein
MPIITLDIPQNKLPLVKEFINEIGLKVKNMQSVATASYVHDNANARRYVPSSYSYSTKGWEFYSNELEFE